MLWDNWGDGRSCDEGHWHTHARALWWGLPEVVGTVQQVHCSWRRFLQRGLAFHVCTINKSGHTKKVWKLIQWSSYIYIYIYLPIVLLTWVQSQVKSYHRLKKRYLISPWLTLKIIRYGSRIREAIQGKELNLPLHLSVVAIEKGSLYIYMKICKYKKIQGLQRIILFIVYELFANVKHFGF